MPKNLCIPKYVTHPHASVLRSYMYVKVYVHLTRRVALPCGAVRRRNVDSFTSDALRRSARRRTGQHRNAPHPV